MERFIFLILAVLTLQAHANPLSSKNIEHMTHEIQVINGMIDENNEHLVSDFVKNKLLAQHRIMTQYFADPQVNAEQKTATLTFSQSLADVLNQLGEQVVRVDSVPAETDRGSGSGVIRGFVRDDATENPINNALVSVYTATGVYVDSVYSDNIGRYALTNMTAGQYIVLVSVGNSYMTTLYDGILCQGGLGVGCQANQANVIQVEAAQVVEQINFNLNQYGQVTGKLIDAQNNQPIYANVSVYDSGYNFIASTNTSYNDGEFSVLIPGLGDHYLAFSSSDYQSKMYDDVSCTNQVCDLTTATAFQVGLNETFDTGVTALVRNSQISGRVVDVDTGLPTYNTNSVEVYDAINGYYMGYGYPDNDGYWASEPMPSGTYHLRNRAYGYLAQYYLNENCEEYSYYSCDLVVPDDLNHDGNTNTTGVDFELQSGGVIEGVTKDHTNSPVGAYVRLYNAQGDNIASDYTDNAGNYEFSGLSNGTYYVSAHNDSHQVTMHPNVLCTSVTYSDRCETPAQGNPIVINALETEVKHVRMRTGATFSGIIRDLNNNPINGARVRFTADQATYQVYTDSDGQYEVNNVRAGAYHMVGSNSQYASVVWPNHVCATSNQCDTSQGVQINISGTNTNDSLNLRLPELGVLNVTVKNTANQPVSSGNIHVSRLNGDYVGTYYLNDGVANLSLYDGSYQFYYYDNYGEHVSKVYGGANCYQNCQANTGSVVNINLGQTSNLSMTVDSFFKIQGSITAEQPTGYDWKYIKIYQGNVLVESKKFHNDDDYEMVIRYPGPIKVEAYQQGHYSQYYQGVNCYGEDCGLTQATSINVTPNQTRSMDFQLDLLSHVKGQVRNQNGDPLAGIQVKIYKENNYNSNDVVTDANGNYALYGVEPGFYNLRAVTDGVHESTLWGNEPCPYPCSYNSTFEFEVEAGDFINQQNIIMSQRGSLSISGATYFSGGVAADVSVAFVSQTTGDYLWYTTNQNGDLNDVYLPSDNYQLLARESGYGDRLYTAYPAEMCENLTVCLSASPVFQVNGQQSHDLDQLEVHRRGSLRAEFVDHLTGNPISSVRLQLLDSALNVEASVNVNNGMAAIDAIDSGSYYVYAKTDDSSEYQHQLFDGVDCGRGLGIDCLLTDGVTVDFVNNQEQLITFELRKKPTLTVNLVNAYSQQAVSGEVRVFDPSGNPVISSNYGESFELPLNVGQYFVVGSASRHSIQAYPAAPCTSSYDIDSCELSQAMLVNLSASGVSINLGLNLTQGINGQVIDGNTGTPIAGAVVDIWNDYGFLSTSTITNGAGRFSQPLEYYYDYYLSTDIDSSLGLFNEVYNNRLCTEGPAVLGLCDPETGDLIVIDSDMEQAHEIIFELHADPVFQDGFDSP